MKNVFFAAAFLLVFALAGAEYFVSPAGSDKGDGRSEKNAFRTIGKAARVASPGTRVRIHAGTYRECVSSEAGGTGPEHMISYEAYGDGDVIVSAAEVVTEFKPSTGWMAVRAWGAPQPEGLRIWEYDVDPDVF
ncbi:MAG: hypothetical protein J6A21_06465, partial [Lentisphaeria bacterium]|nr:hypothetical protein [Lentisphaeria bacterium]